MGGRPSVHQKYASHIEELHKRLADGSLEALAGLHELARGVRVEETDSEGQKVVYQKPPDYRACVYWLDRLMGKATSHADAELSLARTQLAEQQMAANVFMFQAQFMEAQRQKALQEMDMNTKSYITEEEELNRIQTLVKALNNPLLQMTPESAAEFGMSGDQLESLKAHLGRSQGEILREVIGEGAIVEEDEEDEEEDD